MESTLAFSGMWKTSFILLAYFFVSFGSPAMVNASSLTEIASSPTEPGTLLGAAPPYVPRKTDYAFEGGMMSARDELFWAGAMMGAHVGRCVFSRSETCQQFVDGILGVGLREGETQGHFWLSPRWQFVNFPNRYSPFVRVFGGIANISRAEHRGAFGVFGGGIGITTYLHDKVDLHAETRVLMIDRALFQVLFGVNIKADRLIEYFAVKLKDFGLGTVHTAIDATGTAIEATGEGLGGILKGVIAPFKKSVAPVPMATPIPAAPQVPADK